MVMSGEEVPSYFTHRTTGTSSSLTIPLLDSSLSRPFFRFRACAVVLFDSVPTRGRNTVYIRVNCRFKGRFGDSFESFGQQQSFEELKKKELFILDCRIPLNKNSAPLAQLNYDHVDVQLHVSNTMDSTFRSKRLNLEELRYLSNIRKSEFKLKGWGIRVRLAEDCLSPKNQLRNSNTSPRVCEAKEDNMVNHENKQECGDSCEETEKQEANADYVKDRSGNLSFCPASKPGSNT